MSRADHIDAKLSELLPDELRLWPLMVDAWVRARWLTVAEADEWRGRIAAWERFHRLAEGPRSH